MFDSRHFWMYIQLNSAPRAPIQSIKPRDKITSAVAHPNPAVINLLCPLPGIRDRTIDRPTKSAKSTLHLINSYWRNLIRSELTTIRNAPNLHWTNWVHRFQRDLGKMLPIQASCTAVWTRKFHRLECISRMHHTLSWNSKLKVSLSDDNKIDKKCRSQPRKSVG